MADKKTSTSGDKDFQSFLGLMQSTIGKKEAPQQPQDTGAPSANGPTPQVRKIGRPKKDPMDKVAESLNILVNRDKRWHDDEASDKDSEQRKTDAWRQKMLDLLEGNTGKQKGKTGGAGGVGLIGAAIASLFGKSGIGKIFTSLGRVVKTIVKGGKLFARVLGKAGSTLVEVTKLIGEAVKNPGKFFKSIGSKIGSIGKNVFRRLSGGGGRAAALGEEAAEGAGALGAAGAAGKVGRLGRLGKVGKAAGSLLGKGASKAVPLAGAAFAGVDLASQLHDEYEQKDDTQGIGLGGIANGAMSGGTIGATVGSIIPGVGTAIGAGAGALIGGGASAIMQHKKAIMEELEKMGSGLKDSFSSVTTFMGKLWNGTKVTWERVLYPKVKAIGEGLTTVWHKLEPVMGFIGHTLSGITEGVGKTVTGIFNLFQPLMGSIKTLLDHGGRWLLHRAGVSDDDISAISDAFTQGPISSASADTTPQPPTASTNPTDGSYPAPSAPTDGSLSSQVQNASPPVPTSVSVGAAGPLKRREYGTADSNTDNVDEDRYLASVAQAESSGIPTVVNPNSSATGLWQIVKNTNKGLNHNHGTSISMEDLKDPRKAYIAANNLFHEEKAVKGFHGNTLDKLAVLQALGLSKEWKTWVKDNPNWESTLRGLSSYKGTDPTALKNKALAGTAVYEIDKVRKFYHDGKVVDSRNPRRTQGLIDVAALHDGGTAIASASNPNESPTPPSSPAGQDHLKNISHTLNRQVAIMRDQHQEAMRTAQAQNTPQQTDSRSFDWQGVPVSVAQPDMQRLLSKRT